MVGTSLTLATGGSGGRVIVLDGVFDDYGQSTITFGLDCFDLFPQGIVDFSGYLDGSSSHCLSPYSAFLTGSSGLIFPFLRKSAMTIVISNADPGPMNGSRQPWSRR